MPDWKRYVCGLNRWLYLSGFSFLCEGRERVRQWNEPYLADLCRLESLALDFGALDTSWEAVQFALGIDRLTLYSGNLYWALDPNYGMYWAGKAVTFTQNWKGVFFSSTEEKLSFQYHLGGFEEALKAWQRVSLKHTISRDSGIFF